MKVTRAAPHRVLDLWRENHTARRAPAAAQLLSARLTGQPLGLQALAIRMKRPLRGLVLAHGLLGVCLSGGVTRAALFGGQDSRCAI